MRKFVPTKKRRAEEEVIEVIDEPEPPQVVDEDYFFVNGEAQSEDEEQEEELPTTINLVDEENQPDANDNDINNEGDEGEGRELKIYRRKIKQIASKLQRYCNSFDDSPILNYNRAHQTTNELLNEVDELKKRVFNSQDTKYGNANEQNNNGKQENVEDNQEEPQILQYIHALTTEIDSNLHDDKGSGFKSQIENRLFLLWDKALVFLSKSLTSEDMQKWIDIATQLDTKGQLKLFFNNKVCNQIALKAQVSAFTFSQSPSFESYKVITEKLRENENIESQVKMEILSSLSRNSVDHLNIKAQIFAYEKHYDHLRELLLPMKSSELVIELCRQLTTESPSNRRFVARKAHMEIQNLLVELTTKFVERFDCSGKAFECWSAEDFVTVGERSEDNAEDYEEDHFISQLRDSFRNDESDMSAYDTYLKQYKNLEDLKDTTFEEPYESFKEMRKTERACEFIKNSIISWAQCMKACYENQGESFQMEDSFKSAIDSISNSFDSFLQDNDLLFIGTIAGELVMLENDPSVFERSFLSSCALYSAVYEKRFCEYLSEL